MFENPALTPENDCFCPHGPPCNPNGLLNVSLCQYGKSYSVFLMMVKNFRDGNTILLFLDSPVVLSFPHFYLADDSYRDAVEGVSEPDPSKHRFEIDVQPVNLNNASIQSYHKKLTNAFKVVSKVHNLSYFWRSRLNRLQFSSVKLASQGQSTKAWSMTFNSYPIVLPKNDNSFSPSHLKFEKNDKNRGG